MRVLAVISVLAASSALSAPAVSVSASELTLGDGETIEVRVTHPDPSALSTAISSGTLTLDRVGPDAAVYQWQPPDIRHPTVAVLAFWDRTSTAPDVAVARVALKGRTTLEMDTDRGASVVVQVAGDRFGPAIADGTGRVKVPIAVPPGVRTAQVFATSRGRETSRAVPLEVPTTRPFVLAAGPDPVSDTGGWAQVIQGDPANEGVVRIGSEAAEVTFVEARGGAATFQVIPRQSPADAVTVEAVVEGAPSPMVLTLPRPAVSGEPSPAEPRAAASGWALEPWLLIGGFHAGGANAGPGAELGVSLRPDWTLRALSIDLSFGARRLGFVDERNTLGAVSSELWVTPIDLAARYQLLERGPFRLDVRAGAGLLPWRNTVSAPFFASSASGGVGLEVFGGVEGRYRIGPIAALLQVRGAFARIQSERVKAVPGGAFALIGVQWSPR